MRVSSSTFKLMIWLVVFILVLFTLTSAGKRRRKKRKGCSGAADCPELRKKQIISIHTTIDSTVRLPCKAKKQWTIEEKKILFYWKMHGNLVKNIQPKYRQVNNAYLEIRNVQLSDAGTYTCTAENSNGKDSVDRKLVVNGVWPSNVPSIAKPVTKGVPPPIFTHDFAPRLVNKGRSLVRKKVYRGKKVKMRCAIKAEPTPTITWFRSGKPLRTINAKKYKFKANKYQLVIKNFQSGDAGNYSCLATNKHGRKSMSYFLRYNGKQPSSKPTEFESKTLLRGTDTVLRCSTAKQALMLTWRIPNTSKVRRLQKSQKDYLKHNRMLKFNGSYILNYYLYNVTEEDSGEYQCVGGFSDKNVVRFKVITIKVVKALGDTERPVTVVPSGWRMPLFLVISIPLIAGLFFVVIIIFCWRYHKKLRKHRFAPVSRSLLPFHDDPTEEHILGPIPQGSLRFHKSQSRPLKADSKHLYLKDGEKFYFSHGYLEQNKMNSDSPPSQSRSSASLPSHQISSVNCNYDQNSYQVIPLIHHSNKGHCHGNIDSKKHSRSGNHGEPPDKPPSPSADSNYSTGTNTQDRLQSRRRSAPDCEHSSHKNIGPGRPNTWPNYRAIFLDETSSSSEDCVSRTDDLVDICSCPLEPQITNRFPRKPGARGSRDNLDKNENLCIEGTSLSDVSLKASSSGCSSGASLLVDEEEELYLRRHSICRNPAHTCMRNIGHSIKEDTVYSDPCCDCPPPGYVGVKLKRPPLPDSDVSYGDNFHGDGCYGVCPSSIKHVAVSCGSEFLAQNGSRTCEYSPVGT